jgi:hypothetical protein|tara:strand:- start:1092 stop:1337 length:246 start_codon:yes stop_codon:yes gene_type:complete
MDEELWNAILDGLTVRELQKEAARAISTMPADNNSIYKFNKVAYHNSHLWYKAVIQFYIQEHGDLPSLTGPGVDIKFVIDE